MAGGDIFHISSMYFASASGLTSKIVLPAALTPEMMCAKWRETSSSCCTKLILHRSSTRAAWEDGCGGMRVRRRAGTWDGRECALRRVLHEEVREALGAVALEGLRPLHSPLGGQSQALATNDVVAKLLRPHRRCVVARLL